MTTDPFTAAAVEHLAKVDHDKSREWFDGFVACTRWARDHLAAQETDGGHGPRTTAAIREWAGAWPTAQEPTDAEIDAAAAVIWESYDLLDRAAIRDALAAARAARRAEAERDEWQQTALDERAAALDALEQIKLRDAQIKAAQHALTHRPEETL